MDSSGLSVDSVYEEVLSDVGKLSNAQVAAELRDLLGGRLVAYLASASTTRTVDAVIAGEIPLAAADGERLRTALSLAELQRRFGATERLIQAWFQGSNPRLDDHSPARAIVEGTDVAGGSRSMLSAAVALIAE